MSVVVPVLDLPTEHPLFSAGSKLLAALGPYSYDGGGWFVTAVPVYGASGTTEELLVAARVPEPGYPGEFQGVEELTVSSDDSVAQQVADVRAFYGI